MQILYTGRSQCRITSGTFSSAIRLFKAQCPSELLTLTFKAKLPELQFSLIIWSVHSMSPAKKWSAIWLNLNWLNRLTYPNLLTTAYLSSSHLTNHNLVKTTHLSSPHLTSSHSYTKNSKRQLPTGWATHFFFIPRGKHKKALPHTSQK